MLVALASYRKIRMYWLTLPRTLSVAAWPESGQVASFRLM
jgi:hypothetical protein